MVLVPKPGYYASRPSKSNELHLLRVSKHGNLSNARSAKNQLILQNEGFLKSFIQKWIKERKHLDFDHFLCEARIAFLSAINAYDLSKDVSLRTYARYYLLEIKRQALKGSELLALEEEHDIESCSIPVSDFKNWDIRKCLASAMYKCLSSSERRIVYMHYVQGLKQRQIAMMRSCSEARISTVLKTSLLKLKVYLTSIGVTPILLQLN